VTIDIIAIDRPARPARKRRAPAVVDPDRCRHGMPRTGLEWTALQCFDCTVDELAGRARRARAARRAMRQLERRVARLQRAESIARAMLDRAGQDLADELGMGR
jgi:hypothetical protein